MRGPETVAEVLTDYRDGIASGFEQTIDGMNKGMTPDPLVETVTLPPELAVSSHRSLPVVAIDCRRYDKHILCFSNIHNL